MSADTFSLLNQEADRRDWGASRSKIDELVAVYSGEIPQRFKKYFPKNHMEHVINMTRNAWDDLASSIGRFPELRSEPQNSSDAELKRVGKHEAIGTMYLRESKPSGKLLMRSTAWWLLSGQAVVLVVPDAKKGHPVFTVRDPRTCFPGIKESIGNQIIELNDLIFRYKMPRQTMELMGFASNQSPQGYGSEKDEGTIIEYIDDRQWIMCSDGGTVKRVEHGLGKVPGWVFRTFSPNGTGPGLSQFQDQLTLMVAVSQLISQKIAFGERLIYPLTWARGYEGAIKVGPNVINKLGQGGEMGQLTPPTTFQVDQDIAMLERFARILNKNPEVRQGEVNSKGAYVGAKTLEQLSESLDTVMAEHWDIISTGFQHLLSVAFCMDEQLFDFEKSINGNYGKLKTREKYLPSKDIKGRYLINVDYGFGLDGYQGFLQHLQAKDSRTMSRLRVIEAMPGTRDAEAEIKQMDLEALDEAGLALLQSQAASGQLDMVMWAKIRKEMAEKGTPIYEVIADYQEMLQEQAAAAAQAGGTAGMTAPPGPTEEVPAAPAALPGLPPSAALGV